MMMSHVMSQLNHRKASFYMISKVIHGSSNDASSIRNLYQIIMVMLLISIVVHLNIILDGDACSHVKLIHTQSDFVLDDVISILDRIVDLDLFARGSKAQNP